MSWNFSGVLGQPALYTTQRQFEEENRREPSHPSKVQENDFLPIFPGFTQGKLGVCRMYSEVGKQTENTEFSRLFRFVKLLVNEGFLP